eukprot:scaffold3297_cov143-Skeletonema_dohrnii-CCMP3373.AAC.3
MTITYEEALSTLQSMFVRIREKEVQWNGTQMYPSLPRLHHIFRSNSSYRLLGTARQLDHRLLNPPL